MKRILMVAMIASAMASCSNNKAEEQARQQATIDSMKMEMAKKQMADSINQAIQLQQAQSVDPNSIEMSGSTTAAAPRKAHRSSGNSGSSSIGTSSGGGNSTATTTTTTTTKQKKGWNAKTKGAIIGAGAGAITGAMVDKKKGEGAIIGGILGAGAGVGVGAIIDKKQKDKKEAENK